MMKTKADLLLLLLAPLLQQAHATDCEPNGYGGTFCINDDGTTSDSIPNEVNGQDVYSSNGTSKIISPDESGMNNVLNDNDDDENSDLNGSLDPDSLSSQNNTNQGSTGHDEANNPLMGRDWNSPANINSDGSATSSINPDE
ncbi:hypothetical protein [Escherichia coli]|uniref:hypothetical protein n=1 Tax=Escherichia coli TaxID=562 RepID=UPI00077227A5|nr:hypothetical protein [Escherichia coli]KXG73461.1 hypothetical protein LT30_00077 [Escherichia coli]MDE8019994.1 RND transporter [Escherichia coli]MDH6765179.1 RND transporter [Escherichia coli]